MSKAAEAGDEYVWQRSNEDPAYIYFDVGFGYVFKTVITAILM